MDEYDTYIQWIEYSVLMNIREMTPLHHGCTHIADLTMNGSTRVSLKMIVDNESFDFHQVKLFHVQTMQSINIYRTFNIDYYYYDCILFTQIVNQGIPRHINTRQCLDNWNYSGAIYSRILFSFLSRRTCTVGQVHTMLQ